ncbi:hypothetical protein BSL82_03630 [Tardibacter chloracetimidivorans]|uniref:DNA-directed RNA polymerase n=1 Tax=Tardibacter chloracetimidivorans TaxID=1921510 RepID=A0A1L3ZSA6_9SPHN|nr:DNA-directed RNA polymerase [Tardibacter chloracetimidivorans]API58508.1 hypothetical protein BSL82_03630 [Tardibacter chloracetimidivorans]
MFLDSEDLLKAQAERDALSLADGYIRFNENQKRLEKNEGAYATLESSKVIRGCIPLVTKEIERYFSETKDKLGKGKTPFSFSVLRDFDPSKAAYIGLNSVINAIGSQKPLSQTLVTCGRMVHSEHVALKLERERGKKIAERIGKKLSMQGSSANRSKAFKKLVEDQDIEFDDWSADVSAKVGEPLVNAVLKALPDIFKLETVFVKRGSSMNLIVLTDEGSSLLRDIREAASWMRPVLRPMVVAPRPWESFYTGCYYDERLARTVPLMRTSQKDHRRLLKVSLGNGQMAYVLEALNAIQETPFAINEPVYGVIKWAWENNIEIEGFPRSQRIDLPPRVDAEVWEQMDQRQRKGKRLTVAQIHQKNRSIDADVKIMLDDLTTAKELMDYDRFYLPCNLDFRGRVYPVCHFNNQRSDHVKALFRFADGKPLGPSGASWLCVHLANCGDFERVSKRPFGDRLRWVEDNHDQIIATANDPIGTLDHWSQADSPFMYLAACMEYAKWRSSGSSEEFISYLPVALDGSNSGLQHYSAALRCEREAAMVCLTEALEPADAYQIVADAANELVKLDAANGDVRALKLLELGGLDRKIAKRNVMTFAYSSEQFGFGQQQVKDTMGPENDAVLKGLKDRNKYELPILDPKSERYGEPDNGVQLAHYIAAKVWHSVNAVVTEASKGMSFFKKVAGTLAHEGKPLTWVTPVGLPVLHKYTQWDVKRVKMFLFDRDVALVGQAEEGSLREVRANIRTKPLDRIDKEKAKNAVAPNVIHSMDAAHLMLTVLASKAEGIEHFSLIHDSFGTHAGSTERFFHIIREAFVDMYENYCPLTEVYENAARSLDDPSRLPEVPTIGNWEVREVLDAPYAFA